MIEHDSNVNLIYEIQEIQRKLKQGSNINEVNNFLIYTNPFNSLQMRSKLTLKASEIFFIFVVDCSIVFEIALA